MTISDPGAAIRHALTELARDAQELPPDRLALGARKAVRRRRARTAAGLLTAAVAVVLPVTAVGLANRDRPSPVGPATVDSRPGPVDARCREAALGRGPDGDQRLPSGSRVTEVLWCDVAHEQVGGSRVTVAVERRADRGLGDLTGALAAPDEGYGAVRCRRSAPAMPRVWVRLSTGAWFQPAWPRGECGPLANGWAIVRRMPFREVARQVVGPDVSAMTRLSDLKCPGDQAGTQYDYGTLEGVPRSVAVERAITAVAEGSPAQQRWWRGADPVAVAMAPDPDLAGELLTGNGIIVWFSEPDGTVVAGVRLPELVRGGYYVDSDARCAGIGPSPSPG